MLAQLTLLFGFASLNDRGRAIDRYEGADFAHVFSRILDERGEGHDDTASGFMSRDAESRAKAEETGGDVLAADTGAKHSGAARADEGPVAAIGQDETLFAAAGLPPSDSTADGALAMQSRISRESIAMPESQFSEIGKTGHNSVNAIDIANSVGGSNEAPKLGSRRAEHSQANKHLEGLAAATAEEPTLTRSEVFAARVPPGQQNLPAAILGITGYLAGHAPTDEADRLSTPGNVLAAPVSASHGRKADISGHRTEGIPTPIAGKLSGDNPMLFNARSGRIAPDPTNGGLIVAKMEGQVPESPAAEDDRRHRLPRLVFDQHGIENDVPKTGTAAIVNRPERVSRILSAEDVAGSLLAGQNHFRNTAAHSNDFAIQSQGRASIVKDAIMTPAGSPENRTSAEGGTRHASVVFVRSERAPGDTGVPAQTSGKQETPPAFVANHESRAENRYAPPAGDIAERVFLRNTPSPGAGRVASALSWTERGPSRLAATGSFRINAPGIEEPSGVPSSEQALSLPPGDRHPAPGVAAAGSSQNGRFTPSHPIMRQIGEAIAQDMRNTMEIRLSPEELGVVRMILTPGDTGLSVQILADRSETLDLMRRHIDQLARDLAQAGHDACAFTFGHDRKRDGAHHGRKPPAGAEGQTDAGDGGSMAEPGQGSSPEGLDIRL